MATKKLSGTMLLRLCAVVKAGNLALPFSHRGGWIDFKLSATDQALVDRKLVTIVTLKADSIVGGGMKTRYARATDTGREYVKNLVANPASVDASTENT